MPIDWPLTIVTGLVYGIGLREKVIIMFWGMSGNVTEPRLVHWSRPLGEAVNQTRKLQLLINYWFNY